MTLQELQAIVEDVRTKANMLQGAASNLASFMEKIYRIINDPDFSSTINVDAFVAIQTPLYLEHLHNIEVAADVLGTDPFS